MDRKDILDKYGIRDPYATEDDQIEYIKENGPNVIRYINVPSERVQLEIVTVNPSNIQLINNPTKVVQLCAVRKNPYVIMNIYNQYEEVQFIAVKENADLLKYCISPNKRVQAEVLKHNVCWPGLLNRITNLEVLEEFCKLLVVEKIMKEWWKNKMKPISKNQMWIRMRFAHPHDTWYNNCEGRRIARRRWKRHYSKEFRRIDKKEEVIEENMVG